MPKINANQVLKEIQSYDYSKPELDANVDEIVDLLCRLGEINLKLDVVPAEIDINGSFVRVRRPLDGVSFGDSINQVSHLGAPPKESTPLNRVNFKRDPMMYAVVGTNSVREDLQVAITESGVQLGEEFAFIKYSLRRECRLDIIVPTALFPRRFNEQSSCELTKFFVNEFYKSPNDFGGRLRYVLTANLVNLLYLPHLASHSDRVYIYPSFALGREVSNYRRESINIAFEPNVVREKLKVESVYRMKLVDLKGNSKSGPEGVCEVLSVADVVDSRNDAEPLLWRNLSEIDYAYFPDNSLAKTASSALI